MVIATGRFKKGHKLSEETKRRMTVSRRKREYAKKSMICEKCNTEFEGFYVQALCCSCRKEALKEYKRNYAKKNADKIRARYAKNKENISINFRAYYLKHRERILEARSLYNKNNQWDVSFYGARNRCLNATATNYHRYGGRGISFFLSKEQVKKLWVRDGAENMKKPSIDRIDNDGHYEFTNCRFIEQAENVRRAVAKTVAQYSLTGKLIRGYESISTAHRETGISLSCVSRCCHNEQKSTGGFIWKFV